MQRQPVHAAPGRYTAVAVVLHWLMAAAIILMLAMGLYMTSDLPDRAAKFQIFQLHKSVGIVLLWLIAVRLAWRLAHRAPELAGPYPKWERALATLGHAALYILMVAMPLSGWLLVSASPLGLPTILFQSGIEWPHVPGVGGNEQVGAAAGFTHYWLAWLLIAGIAGHVLAVVKHWLVDRENILVRMWFPLKFNRRRNAEKLLLIGALVLAATAAQARPYAVDYAQSRLGFGGTYADKVFAGTFGSWTAAIDFDASNIAASRIEATIDMASATTGDKTYDSTLPTADWFDTAHYPQATFKADSVERRSADAGSSGYIAHGTLTLKGRAHPQDLAFTLTPADADGPTAVAGTASLNRLDYGIGAKSDASGDWVGREIVLTLALQATPR